MHNLTRTGASRTAVVTGAFSFTGRFIARELIARGWSVRTLTTRDTRATHRPMRLISGRR